jgi:uncharacterized membrane protein YhaH (DUF805 family)
MVQYYMDVVTKHYFDFNGRARRSEFWYFALVNLIIVIVLDVIGSILHLGQVLGGLYNLAVLLPSLGVAVRRLHDTGRSGWWLLIALIPLVGWAVLIYWYCLEGPRSANEFGADPKAG